MRVFFYDTENEESIRDLGKKLRAMNPGKYRVEVYQKRAIRSLRANAYYHVILNIIAIDTGHTHEQLHEICKNKFNADVIHLPKGGMVMVGKTTTNLDTAEFTGYVNRVKQWANDEFGIVIPEPDKFDDRRIAEIQNLYDESQSG